MSRNILSVKPPTKISNPIMPQDKPMTDLPADSSKSAKIRRQRGYNWEDTIVKRFGTVNNWKAFRLGSPSIGLPDVLAVNTQQKTIYAIEAKSGTVSSLPVPADQIQRCMKWVNTFDLYEERKVILAFKFLSKKRIGIGKYESRVLREFFKVWEINRKIEDCYCTYEGKVFTRDGTKTELDLCEQKMPFKTRQPSGLIAQNN